MIQSIKMVFEEQTLALHGSANQVGDTLWGFPLQSVGVSRGRVGDKLV